MSSHLRDMEELINPEQVVLKGKETSVTPAQTSVGRTATRADGRFIKVANLLTNRILSHETSELHTD